ncbi:MAG: alpha/beta hydrolase [Treponema sp.]|nr:alpha/beta hydrolase [Treponema sp.]
MAANASKEIISIYVNEPVYFLDEEVTYAQADAWFGHVTRDLRMDIIYPQDNERQYPCIIWVCGGGWMQMNKGAHIPYLADLARRGFVVASVDYRLGHEAPFPAAIIDIKAAIRYLRAHAKRYSINREKFGVSGESAGGYLTAMTALIRGKQYEAGEYLDQSSAVQAACPWYMPCDLTKMVNNNLMKPAFFSGDPNDEEYCRTINPITYITAQAPPFLIFHGAEDTLVPPEQGEMFYSALVDQNINARFIKLNGAGHADAHFFQRPLWDIMADFFKEKLK